MPKALTVVLLLFVSGTCSLLFQTAWFREFRLVFGASTYSSAAVMAIFMGGLGLGNALLGRRADRSSRPLQLYARFEILISVWGALTPLIVDSVRLAYLMLGGQETLGIYGATTLRLLGTALVIGVPTFLMGGTLPAAVKAISREEDQGRGVVGILYGMNTFGAVLGALLGTFYLFELFGTRVTFWLACAANLFNALVAWVLAERSPKVMTLPISAAANDSRSNSDPSMVSVPARVLYLSAALIGAVFFLMEMVWYRMLGPILGGSTFTFGLILAVALLGIGLGGAIYSWRFGTRRPGLGTFIQTLSLEALAIAIPFWLGDFLAILAMQLRGFAIYGFWGQAAGWLVVTFIVVFPASVIAGIQFPALIALVGKGTKDIGRELGQTFAWNTIGSMIGSFAGGFGLMTLLSALGVWKLVVVLLVALAVVLCCYQIGRIRWHNMLWQVSAALAALICLMAEGPTAVWRHSGIGAGRSEKFGSTQNEFLEWARSTNRQLLWEEDGRESAVGIVASDSLAFIVNGKSDGNAITDAATQIMLGVIGAFQHPDPQRALVIGLGTGESAGWLASLSSMQSVDVIELEPSVLKMAQLCSPINHDVLNHPKVNVIINDAREQVLTTHHQYDLICSEPSNPYRSGISSLYTREFYQAAALRLSKDGVFCQWLQSYEVDTATVRSVCATLYSVFPFVEIWWTQRGDLVLTCSLTPKTYDYQSLKAKLLDPTYALASRTAWQTEQVEGLLSHALANDKFIKRVAEQRPPVNTDDHNLLEFGFARSVGRTSPFEQSDLRLHAESFEERWPTSLKVSLDLQRVADLAVAEAVLNRKPMDSVKIQSARSAIWQMVDAENYEDAARAWNRLPVDESIELDFSEMILLGMTWANVKDPRLPELLQRLNDRSPGCAMAIATVLAIKHAEADKVAEQLAKFFVHLREDPTVPSFLQESALMVAEQFVRVEPQSAPLLYDSLRVPFSLWRFQASRLNALLAAAQSIDAAAVSRVMSELEPNPPWRHSLLELRLNSYRATGSPMLQAAEEDLKKYQNASSSTPGRIF